MAGTDDIARGGLCPPPSAPPGVFRDQDEGAVGGRDPGAADRAADARRLRRGPFRRVHAPSSGASGRAFSAGRADDPRDAWDSCLIHLGQWLARRYGGFWCARRRPAAPVGPRRPLAPARLRRAGTLAGASTTGSRAAGYAAEAARAARGWARGRARPGRLMSLIAPENPRSTALAERLGAARERRIKYARPPRRRTLAPPGGGGMTERLETQTLVLRRPRARRLAGGARLLHCPTGRQASADR